MGKVALYDHVVPALSGLDMEMIRHVPPGGNWMNIPRSVPSKRLEQIREMAAQRGGAVRTTYYGRLRPERPAYTISTYFNRPGNGCNVHPFQDRTLSIREAARLQSFPDRIKFVGGQTARRKQVGNAVPPLLGRAVGSLFPPGVVIDLFAGAGGLSLGFELAGHTVALACDNDAHALSVHAASHPSCKRVNGDIDDDAVRMEIRKSSKQIDMVIGGPPCQGWSYGGWHTHDDPRNRLVWSFIEMVNAIEPRYFVMENVQGLQWMAKGQALLAIKEALARKYRVKHFVLNAADYGVPQLRNRIFIVGGLETDAPGPPAQLFSGKADAVLPAYVSSIDAIGDLPPLLPGEGEDVLHWVDETDEVPYRQFLKGCLDFDGMYQKYKGAFKTVPVAAAI